MALTLQYPIQAHLLSQCVWNNNACRHAWGNRIDISVIRSNGVKDNHQVSSHDLLNTVGLGDNCRAVSTPNLCTATTPTDKCLSVADGFNPSDGKFDVTYGAMCGLTIKVSDAP